MSAGETVVRLALAPDSIWISLPHRWIDAKTLRLTRGDTLLVRGVDFLLDPRGGRLRLLTPRIGPPPLVARFRYFPVELPGEVRRYRPLPLPGAGEREADAGLADPDSARTGAERLVRVERRSMRGLDTSRLRIAGSKTFAIETGTQQDFSLDQSLDLTVRGQLGRDVEVRAVLTDRQTGASLGGTSAALSDLDKILIDVEGPRARMTLGDFALETPRSGLAPVRRQLEGARAEWTPNAGAAFGAFATSAGRPARFEFLGEDGKQGPYRLVGAIDEGAAIVVPGSERVEIDGRRMVRGEGDDYVIDYAAGTLTFTSRRLITSYTRIGVDCQISSDDYRRSISHVGGRLGRAGEASGWRAFVVSEDDDRDSPLGPSLSERDRAALRAAGDSLTPEIASGVSFVGPGEGDYERVEADTVAVPFYRFVGRDEGSFDVAFRPVPPGEGDYADTTTTEAGRFFVFVGRDAGDHDVGRELPRPQSGRVFSLGGDLVSERAWNLAGEIAVSEFDANTFSSIDDGDNRGAALGVRAQTPQLPVAGAQVLLTGEWREVGRRYRPLDRIDAAFSALDWNVDPTRLERGERRARVGTEIRAPGVRARIDGGVLDNRRDFEALRGTFELEATRGAWWLRSRNLTTASHDDADSLRSDGARATHDASLGWRGGTYGFESRYRHERTRRGEGTARAGDYFHETSARVDRRTGSWTTGFEGVRRETWTWDGPVARRRDLGRTVSADLEWSGAGGRSVALGYALRWLRPRGASPETRHLGNARWVLREWQEALVQEGRVDVSTAEASGRRKEIVFVGDGVGHYDSLGVYQGIGDYEVFYSDPLEAGLVQRVDLALRSELERGEIRAVHYWSAAVETERSAGRFVRALPRLLLGTARSLQSSVEQRLDLSGFATRSVVSPRVRLEERRSALDTGGGTREASLLRRLALRARSRPAASWSVELEHEWDRDARRLDVDGSEGTESGWRSRRVRCEQRLSVRSAVTLGLDLGRRVRHRLERAERAEIWELSPSAVWTTARRTRVELRSTRLSVDRSGAEGRADRSLERPGWTSRLLTTIRLGASFDLSATLRETRPDDGQLVRDARVELRATF